MRMSERDNMEQMHFRKTVENETEKQSSTAFVFVGRRPWSCSPSFWHARTLCPQMPEYAPMCLSFLIVSSLCVSSNFYTSTCYITIHKTYSFKGVNLGYLSLYFWGWAFRLLNEFYEQEWRSSCYFAKHFLQPDAMNIIFLYRREMKSDGSIFQCLRCVSRRP